ncbi:sensor histidine kinase [Agromyces sp. MMS24-JH15]|uniref:sensor histidine kinase n=1 Tax=Agromyces sp. MMS24-JH15 TaxID=3243765 RepID=UPI003747E590
MIPRNLGIRTRIVGGSLIIAILISTAAGIVLDSQIDRIVREGTTTVLRSESAPYVTALETEPTESFDSPGPSQLVAVVAPDGSTPVDTLPGGLDAQLSDLTGAEHTTSVTSAGSTYLVRSTPVEVFGQTWHVVAARSADAEDDVLMQMRLLLVLGLALIALGTAAAAWLLTSASLSPVTGLRTSAKALSVSETDELLPVGDTNDEIAELARTLNGLIERLRASANRERQLVSDASHELRTPLALLTTQLQVAIAEASSKEQLLADLEGAQRNVVRLSSLVSSLLELSEIEAVGRGGRATGAELGLEAVEAVDRARFHARERAIAIGYAGIPNATDGPEFAIRAADFGRIIDNLTNNSLGAITDPGRIDIRLELDGDRLRLEVADTGGGLDPAFEPAAFDRFSRQDPSRGPGKGAGLGLAIVAAIVENADGEIRLENRPGDGLTVIVSLRALG